MSRTYFFLGISIIIMVILFQINSSRNTDRSTAKNQTIRKQNNPAKILKESNVIAHEKIRPNSDVKEVKPLNERAISSLESSEINIGEVLNQLTKCMAPEQTADYVSKNELRKDEIITNLSKHHGDPKADYIDWEIEEYQFENGIIRAIRTDAYFNDLGQELKEISLQENQPGIGWSAIQVDLTGATNTQDDRIQQLVRGGKKISLKQNRTVKFTDELKIEIVEINSKIETIRAQKNLKTFDCNSFPKGIPKCSCN